MPRTKFINLPGTPQEKIRFYALKAGVGDGLTTLVNEIISVINEERELIAAMMERDAEEQYRYEPAAQRALLSEAVYVRARSR